MSKASPEYQPTEEELKDIQARNEKLLKLVAELMPIIKKHIEDKSLTALDVAEALSTGVVSTLIAITPPEMLARVQTESTEIGNQTLKALRSKKVGMDMTIVSQVIGQAKVLSYVSNYAAYDVAQSMKESGAKVDGTH